MGGLYEPDSPLLVALFIIFPIFSFVSALSSLVIVARFKELRSVQSLCLCVMGVGDTLYAASVQAYYFGYGDLQDEDLEFQIIVAISLMGCATSTMWGAMATISFVWVCLFNQLMVFTYVHYTVAVVLNVGMCVLAVLSPLNYPSPYGGKVAINIAYVAVVLLVLLTQFVTTMAIIRSNRARRFFKNVIATLKMFGITWTKRVGSVDRDGNGEGVMLEHTNTLSKKSTVSGAGGGGAGVFSSNKDGGVDGYDFDYVAHDNISLQDETARSSGGGGGGGGSGVGVGGAGSGVGVGEYAGAMGFNFGSPPPPIHHQCDNLTTSLLDNKHNKGDAINDSRMGSASSVSTNTYRSRKLPPPFFLPMLISFAPLTVIALVNHTSAGSLAGSNIAEQPEFRFALAFSTLIGLLNTIVYNVSENVTEPQSVNDIVGHEQLRKYLHEFLKSTMREENLLFVVAVDSVDPQEDESEQLRAIADEYLKAGAAQEINVSFELRDACLKTMQLQEFLTVRAVVVRQMHMESWPAFRRSSEFERLKAARLTMSLRGRSPLVTLLLMLGLKCRNLWDRRRRDPSASTVVRGYLRR